VSPRRSRTRGVLAVVGVLLSCVLLVAAALGIWAKRSFLKTEVFADRAGNLIDDPGVQTALAGYLSDQLNLLIDAEAVLAEALPDRAALLAVPLSTAVEDFVTDKVNEFVSSSGFAELWKGAVEVAHREAVRVLEGDTPLVAESEDQIVINLLPVVNAILARIGEASPELLGRSVDLPTVTVDDVPDEAREAIGNALGRDLDDDFGTFTVYDDGALTAAQDAMALSNKAVWVLVALVPLAIALTLWASPRRRRTLLQLCIGAVVAMVVVRRIVFLFQDELLDLVRIDRNRPAVEATSDAFLGPLHDGALWIGLIALAIAAAAALTGPYSWAVSVRRRTVGTARALRSAVGERSEDEATLAWISAHQDALRLAGAAVGVLLFWWLDLSWLGFFLLAGLVALYELAVSRLTARAEPVAVEA
jgi:hypothetical protein